MRNENHKNQSTDTAYCACAGSIQQLIKRGAHRFDPAGVAGAGDVEFVGHHFSADGAVGLDEFVTDVEIDDLLLVGQRGELGVGLADRFVSAQEIPQRRG